MQVLVDTFTGVVRHCLLRRTALRSLHHKSQGHLMQKHLKLTHDVIPMVLNDSGILYRVGQGPPCFLKCGPQVTLLLVRTYRVQICVLVRSWGESKPCWNLHKPCPCGHEKTFPPPCPGLVPDCQGHILAGRQGIGINSLSRVN